MAGVIIILMGLLRFGTIIKFIPYPVTTGFTSGIAVIIFSTQINNFLGLKLEKVPEDFIAQWQFYFHRIAQIAASWFAQGPSAHSTAAWTPHALLVGLGSLLVLFGLRRFAPRLPGAIIVVLLASAVVYLFQLPVEYDRQPVWRPCHTAWTSRSAFAAV